MNSTWRHWLGHLLLAVVWGWAPVVAGADKATWVIGGDGPQQMLLHVASRGGLFKQEGVDLEIVNPHSGPRATAAVLGGSAEMGTAGVSQMLVAVARGSPIVNIAIVLPMQDEQLVLSNEAIKKVGITPSMSLDERVKRLRDLKIGITSPGSGTDLFIRNLLRFRGIDPDSALKLEPMAGGPAMLAALEHNLIDGFVWGSPESLVVVNRKLGEIVVDPFKGEVPELKDVPFLTLWTSRETLAKKPEILRGVVRGIAHAIRLVHDKPNEARRLFRLDFPDIDQTMFDQAFDQYLKIMPTTPVIQPAQLQKALDWYNKAQSKPISVDVKSIIDNRFAEEAAATYLK